MRKGTFDVAFKAAKYHRDSANICAYGPALSVQLIYETEPINFALDTGAIHTDLYTSFATSFPAVMATGHKDIFNQKGIGSSENFPIVVLPPVHFDLAGYPVTLSPARVFLKPSVRGNSAYFYGNLGMDLLGQGKDLAFDFQAMQLSLR
jgi:hypothetical protein